MADHSTQNGTSNPTAAHLKLAALLRECATHVERNEFHPDMYQALALLHTYAGEHAGNPNACTNNIGSTVDDRQISPKNSSGSFEDSATHLMNSLGKKFTKGLGSLANPPSLAHGNASATSQKNAQRVKADLETHAAKRAEVGHRSKENDWCDEHFCLGCQCKAAREKRAGAALSTAPPTHSRTDSKSPTAQMPSESSRQQKEPSTLSSSSSRVTVSSTTTTTSRPSKPAFQRPVNPNSILIANGWIEQQRRSKMRIVWKHVLASLVEGRKPGEETTLWIQREVTNAISGKAELEALHQIPIKWLTSVEYLDYSTDHRFALKVYNVAEEFTFRCADQEAAQNWVLTLQSVREIAAKQSSAQSKSKESSNASAAAAQETAPPASHRMTISELRAIAHGAGISTAGMERQELEKAVANIAGGAQSDTDKQAAAAARRKREMDEQRRRGQEAAALEEKRRKQQALEEAQRLQEEADRRKRAAAQEAERRMRAEEERRRQAEEVQRLRKEQEEQRRRAEEERVRKLAEEERLRRQMEDERRRQAEEEALRRRQAEEEALRRRQAEEEQRRRAAEQQAAEQRRRQEEAQRQQQQRWQQDQQQQRWQQQQWQQQQQANQQQHARQQTHFGAGPVPPQQQQYRATSPQGHHTPPPPPPPPGTGAPTSPVNQKYAKMAADDDDDGGQVAITQIKHSILIHWALQPPQLQVLRPIDILITTIHNVFPPAFGVAGHEYFTKWRALQRDALLGPGLRPDEEKLKKSVRKLRFYLHPDKLPRDLTDEQQFVCKMLWDVTSDAWEEFEKHKEELDWLG